MARLIVEHLDRREEKKLEITGKRKASEIWRTSREKRPGQLQTSPARQLRVAKRPWSREMPLQRPLCLDLVEVQQLIVKQIISK